MGHALDQTEIFEVARRLLAHVEKGTTDCDPRGPLRVPASTYTDAALFAQERRDLFGEGVHPICHSGDLPNPGDYLTHELLGLPIVAIRGSDGVARAFVNTCTHRAARLLDGRGETGPGIVCPYHAWRFDCQGKLAQVNAATKFGSIDRDRYGLRELPCEERHGFLFVAPGGGSLDLGRHLGDLEAQLAFFDLAQCVPVASERFEVRANWKLSLDTFSEGYHFTTLHRNTLARATLGNVMTYDRFGSRGEHHRLGYPSKSLTDLAHKPSSEWGDPYEHFGFVYFVFPNVSMLISARYVDVFRIYPGPSVGEQTTLYDLYARAPLPGEAERTEALEYFRFTYDVVEREDFWVTEQEQRNLESGAVASLTFGCNEPALINLHEVFSRSSVVG